MKRRQKGAGCSNFASSLRVSGEVKRGRGVEGWSEEEDDDDDDGEEEDIGEDEGMG